MSAVKYVDTLVPILVLMLRRLFPETGLKSCFNPSTNPFSNTEGRIVLPRTKLQLEVLLGRCADTFVGGDGLGAGRSGGHSGRPERRNPFPRGCRVSNSPVHRQRNRPVSKVPATPQEWTSAAAHLRHHLLDEVVYHGWPKEWLESAPKFEEVGVIETGDGYRIHKLRYEIVPGFEGSALLYEPDHISGKAPAILNLAGHDGPSGYAYEFKQKRCISYAKHGILALNLEWFGFGELDKKGNEHWDAADLDLVGANGLGIFYLDMRRGLDYLYNLPSVDRNRIGVTGLSGGGWQTIVLSSLDERVKATNPVAGFSSLISRIEVKEYGDMGDVEQSATDFLQGSDYPFLVALLAPRPALLTYNGEDDCCFRAMIVKPRIYDAVQPFLQSLRKIRCLHLARKSRPWQSQLSTG